MFAKLRSYPRILWILALATVVSAYGESFFWPLTMTYIHDVFGQSLTVSSMVLILQYGAALIGNMTGGILFDRWSGRKVILISLFSLIGLLVLMGMTGNFVLYVLELTVIGFFQGMLWPGMRALSGALWPEGGRRAINMLYVANNVGVALGAASGGIVASLSFQAAFYCNAGAYVIFLIIFLLTVREHHLARTRKLAAEAREQGASAGRVPKSTWTALGLISFGMAMITASYMQWQTTMPSYLKMLGIPLAEYTVLWTVNGLVIVLGQPLLSWFIGRYAQSLRSQVVIGGLLFAAAMGIITTNTGYWAFVLGMVILTFGEMLIWPGVPAIAAELALPGREGLFQGIAATGSSAGRMVGPLLGSTLYESYSAQWMLAAMTLLSLLATAAFLFTRRPARTATDPLSMTKVT